MLPPGQPTLLVGAMHAGEIDTVLDQSVKATADVDLWHKADIRCAAKFVGYWTNNGQRSVLTLDGYAANDP
jgi:hypothetical protein